MHGSKNGCGFYPLIAYYPVIFNGSRRKKLPVSMHGSKNGCGFYPLIAYYPVIFNGSRRKKLPVSMHGSKKWRRVLPAMQ